MNPDFLTLAFYQGIASRRLAAEVGRAISEGHVLPPAVERAYVDVMRLDEEIEDGQKPEWWDDFVQRIGQLPPGLPL